MTTPATAPLYIQIHPDDNVAIVVNDSGLKAGARFTCGLELIEAIPQGHKVALRDIAKGAAVTRYNVVIGYALEDMPRGSWVNEQRLEMPEAPSLSDLPMATARAPEFPTMAPFTFMGYRNDDGTVGTRNVLAISTSVQCVSGVVAHAVQRIKSELLARYPNVDDVVAIDHTYGCGVAINAPGADVPIRTLRNIALNPNFGGQAMVVSLGCEKLQPNRLLPEGTIPILKEEPYVVVLQDEKHVGFDSMVDAIVQMAVKRLERLNLRTRVPCPVSDLTVGVQCGGSDAFSGLTANPAVGFASDLLVRAGATVMFSEVTEVRDGIAQLTARAENPHVAQRLIDEMAWYDNYLKQGGADRSANTSPGNKKGGLSNIVEKAMGSIIKSGTSLISGVVSPGEKTRQKGLLFTATPASDFICGTLQMAAGMNMHVFTTGRGTPYGLPAIPVIKVATRSDLARRWHDLMDINAGTIATGQASIEQVGWELFHFMLEVASGKKKTWAEHWKIQNALALFNPGPVT